MMNKKDQLMSAVLSIILGLLLIIMKNKVINITIAVFGIAILISATIDFINKLINIGIVKAVVGVCVLFFGWMFVNLALYIVAAAILIMGLLQIVNIQKYTFINISSAEKVMIYIKPILTVIAGGFLLFNQGGTLAWVFVLTGTLLIIQGVLGIVVLLKR